jgi:alkylhydroperoxidase/carboxymuconolactone decarboxylase family protein YurZ
MRVACSTSMIGGPSGGARALDYTDHLRLLALNDTAYVGRLAMHSDLPVDECDAKTLSLARLGALIATGGAVPSYCAETEAALDAGATPAELVAVLLGVASVVGMPCIVEAAPNLALALGYDTAAALEGVKDPALRSAAE